MTKINVPFVVRGQNIYQKAPPKRLSAGGQNYFFATFDFDETWKSIPYKKATFRLGKDAPIVVDIAESECVIPHEMMQKPGFFTVGVFGGDLLPTGTATVEVMEGVLTAGDDPEPPTPDWFDRIENRLDNLEEGGGGGGGTGGTITDEQIGKAVEDYLQENPVEAPVQSVNGKTGAVKLTAEDVGALSSDTQIPAPYTLPTASAEVKGGVRIGKGLAMDGDVMGVDVDEYEDIETFTTETDMGYPFERTAEPNGTPYNFRKLHVEITNPAWTKSLDKWPQVDTRNGERIQASWRGIISTSQAQLGYLVCEATPDGMLSIRSNVSPLSPSGNYTAIGGNVFDLASTPSNAIIRFLLWASEAGPIIAGTTIKIRGVRA